MTYVSKQWLRDCGWAALLIALLNLPFWVLELRYVVARPVFNADTTLALLLASIAGTWWLLALALAWLLDLLQGLAIGFHFGSVNNLLQSVRFLPHVDITGFLGPKLMVLVAVFGTCLAVVVWIRRMVKPAFSAVLAVFVVLTLSDVVNGSGLPWVLKKDVHDATNVQGSPALNLVAAALARTNLGSAAPPDLDQGLKQELLGWADAHRGGRIFFVIIESWGDPVRPAVRDWIEAPLHTQIASARWAKSRQSVSFKGATTAGEIRLLCASAVHYGQMDEKKGERCIGKSLKELGFRTVALHGFSRQMFDRSVWWGQLGFDQMTFADSLPDSAPRCGKFLRGICDDYMVGTAMKQLDNSSFVYLLTLNTHLPLDPVPLVPSESEFCEQQQLSAPVCQLSVQTRRLIKTVVNFSVGIDPAPLLVLAGDHSPPFFDERDKKMYSASSVPLIVAKPH